MMKRMSFSETIFLFVLALVIFGPKKLPEIARQIGKALNEFRRASNEFKSQIEQEIAHLDLTALLAFWQSEIGRQIQGRAARVHRELAFTARFTPRELREFTGATALPAGALENEFVVVQGVADLVVLLPKEIWLVDFKTDEISRDELSGRVKLYGPQLQLYAAALERSYRRPVTEKWLHFLALRETVTP